MLREYQRIACVMMKHELTLVHHGKKTRISS